MSRPRLQRDLIVRHALAVADAEGVDAASFRRLAADFNVTPMALYRHVTDRADLLAAMTDLILMEIELPHDDASSAAKEDWAQALRQVLRSAVSVYVRHPSARVLTSAGRWTSRSRILTESLIRLLAHAGFTAMESIVIVQRLSDAAMAEIWQVSGDSLREFSGEAEARVDGARQSDPPDPRMFGVELVIAGVEALAAARRADPSATMAPPAHQSGELTGRAVRIRR